MSWFSEAVSDVGNFANKVINVVATPITLPLKVGGQLAEKAIGTNPVTSAYRNLSSAPGDLLGGMSFNDVLAKNKAGLQLAANVGASVATGGISPSALTGLTDLFGGNENVNPVRSASTYETAAPATPIIAGGAGSKSPLLPIALIGGAGILALIVFSKKR